MVSFFNKVKRGAMKFGNKVNSAVGRATALGEKISSTLKKAAPIIDKGIDFVQDTGLTSVVPGLDIGLDSAQAIGKMATRAAGQADRLIADAKRYQRAANEGNYRDITKYAVQDFNATRGVPEAAGSATIEKRQARQLFDELPGEDLFM